MRTTSVVSAAALCLVSACADNIPVEPTTSGLTAFTGSAAVQSSDQATAVIPGLGELGAQFGITDSTVQLLHAEVMYTAFGDYAQSPTLTLANDRMRGIGAEWVTGDPRRMGRVGLTYGIAPLVAGAGVPVLRDPVSGLQRFASVQETIGFIDAGMNAWRDLGCSSAPVSAAANLGQSDVIHGLWAPMSFFTANWGPSGAGILGVTLPFIFVDRRGTADPRDDVPTDIDGNGKADLAQAVIIYNRGYLWSQNGAPNTIDFFSVIAHEVGHAFGLNHFGKIFVTKKNIQVDEDGNPFVLEEDVKYAPKALMNALYIPGNQESVRGIDNGLFCSLWGDSR